MMQKLTKAFVDKIGFVESGQIFYRDSELLGFGLRVGKTAKVYFAESKLNGKTIRVSIARHNVIAVDEARSQAKTILAEISSGKNPHDVEKARKAKLITVAEVLESYSHNKQNFLEGSSFKINDEIQVSWGLNIIKSQSDYIIENQFDLQVFETAIDLLIRTINEEN